jgi:hypothetical protein
MSTSTHKSITRRGELRIGDCTVKVEIAAPARAGDAGAILWQYVTESLSDGARAAGEPIHWSKLTERELTETVSELHAADIIDFGDEFACRNLDGEAVA